MAKKRTSLASSLLEALGVPHTRMYADERFATMPFPSLFGLTRLLKDYGVDSRGMMFTDRSQIVNLETPFLAQTTSSFVVVTALNTSSIGYVDDEGTAHTAPFSAFDKEWTGAVLAAYPTASSVEPNLSRHRIVAAGRLVMDRLFIITSVFLLAAGIVGGHSYASFSDMSAIVIALAGIYVCYLLLLKQMGVRSKAAESVCAVVEAGGCDHVLSTGASKFLGLFGWSELGTAYFSVTLVVMVAAPQWQPWIAMINLFCLPFSFWSVWYQHYRAHAWCTLCLTVQALLWLTFFTQLPSAWWHDASFFAAPTFIIGAMYLFALLAVNRIMRILTPTAPES